MGSLPSCSACAGLVTTDNQYHRARVRTRSGQHGIELDKFPPFINVRDKYEFCDALEEGGTGHVVKGYEKNNKLKQVAIKIICKRTNQGNTSPQALFLNEVDILRRIEHDNVVSIIDIGQDDKYYYIVLQLGTGGDLVGMFYVHLYHTNIDILYK